MSISTHTSTSSGPLPAATSSSSTQADHRDVAHWVLLIVALAILILATSPLPTGF